MGDDKVHGWGGGGEGGTIDLDLFFAPDPYLLEKLKNAATFRNESLTFPDSSI